MSDTEITFSRRQLTGKAGRGGRKKAVEVRTVEVRTLR